MIRLRADYLCPALVAYDWIVNLDEEIHCFWDFRKGRKLAAAPLIYGMARYPLILRNILILQTAFPMSEAVCVRYYSMSCHRLLMPFRRAWSRAQITVCLLMKGCS